jgi:UDP-GlcNAc:undecaprenyl-phosphate GlcNAc-1-phosphate transferase
VIASPAAVLVTAAVAGALATWAAREAAVRLGVVAAPNPIVPQHRRPIAYLGGLGVGAAGTAAIAAAGAPLGWLPGAAAFLLLGVVDDLRPFSPAWKLALQVAAAGFAVASGTPHPDTGSPLADRTLAVAWIVLLVNAVNLTDVCDGLVGGLAAIGLTAVAIAEPAARLPALGYAGACVGFLLWNAPPATIFLGDAGSHLLGFVLAAAILEHLSAAPIASALPMAVAAAAVPLFELGFLVFVRTRKRIPWWRGSPDHFSLRLQAAGFSRWRVLALAWGAAVTIAGAALQARTPERTLLFFVVLGLGAVGAAAALLHLEKATRRGDGAGSAPPD